MVNPKDHPNASAAIIVGYLATAIVYGAQKAGYTLTVQEATTASTALIALVLFLAGKRTRTQPRRRKKTPPKP
jgi:predicted branched-subunit amino acid permease